jgi:hypothetical protein
MSVFRRSAAVAPAQDKPSAAAPRPGEAAELYKTRLVPPPANRFAESVASKSWNFHHILAASGAATVAK